MTRSRPTPSAAHRRGFRFLVASRRGRRSGFPAHAFLNGIAVVAGFAALTFFLMYPLFAQPATTVIDPIAQGPWGWLIAPDVNLVMWILSWDWHALTTAPGSLFDANIFYPARLTLACSEHLLGHLPIFGPVYGLSGNPVLANQVNLLLAFTLSGAALYALLRHWGVTRMGAFLGGFVYAFCPVRLWHVGHVQLAAGQYFPLALLFFDRTLVRARVRDGACFAAFLLLQMLCSYYSAYMALVALTVYGLAVLLTLRSKLNWRGLAAVGIAGLLVAVTFAALSIPYLFLQSTGQVPQYESAGVLRWTSSGFWRNYILPPALFQAHGWGHTTGITNYIGGICILLAVYAAGAKGVMPDRRYPWARAGCLAMVIVCYVMALGPQVKIAGHVVTLPYQFLMWTVPGFSSMRVPSRFGLFTMVGVAALAGAGTGRVLEWRHFATRRLWYASILVFGLVSGTAWEYGLFAARFPVRRVTSGEEVPSVYRALASAPPGPVLEIPDSDVVDSLQGVLWQSEYMYFSTVHWHPLLNGYSGYRPRVYRVTKALADTLPGEKAIKVLQRTTGLRYVVVHPGKLPPWKRRRWAGNVPGLRLVGAYGDDLLFTVRQLRKADLLAEFRVGGRGTRTILGTPLVPLDPSKGWVRWRITSPLPSGGVLGTPVNLEVQIENRSDLTWPAFAVDSTHRVSIAVRWLGPSGQVLAQEDRQALLPYDLAPGEKVRVPVGVSRVYGPGQRYLVIGLSQDGRWFPDRTRPISLGVWRKQ